MIIASLSECHIQSHHQRKSDRKQNNADIGMFAFAHLRDQFLHNNIQHRACDCCIAGMSKLQIEAATITPAAKPVSDR